MNVRFRFFKMAAGLAGVALLACDSPPSKKFQDDFDRIVIGAAWTIDSGVWELALGWLGEGSAGSFVDAQLRYTADETNTGNQFSKMQIVSPGSRSFGFMFRVGDPTGHHYEVHLPSGSTEWRWELNDPDFVERIGVCESGESVSAGDWIGARVNESGAQTVVSVWRWDTDPGGSFDSWGFPDCQITGNPTVAADDGRGLGIRAFTGAAGAFGVVDHWTGGDAVAPVPQPPPPNIVRILSSAGAGTSGSMRDPDGIAVDSLGNVYVGACGFGPVSEGVFKVEPDGAVTKVLGGDGDGTHPATCIVGLAVDSEDSVYAAAYLSDNVFQITPSGTITEILDSSGAGVPGSLIAPIHVAVDGADNLFVSASMSDRVFKQTPAGTISEVLGPAGDGAGTNLVHPFGLDTDAAGSLYVAGWGLGSDAVFRVTPSGTVTVILDAAGVGVDNPLQAPHDIAVDSDDNVFVTGNFSDNVFRVTPTGTVSVVLDPSGVGPGEAFDNPTGIAVDAAGNIYVNGFDSSNMFQVTPAGTVTELIDSSGDGFNDFLQPADNGICAFGDFVYTAGTAADNVFQVRIP